MISEYKLEKDIKKFFHIIISNCKLSIDSENVVLKNRIYKIYWNLMYQEAPSYVLYFIFYIFIVVHNNFMRQNNYHKQTAYRNKKQKGKINMVQFLLILFYPFFFIFLKFVLNNFTIFSYFMGFFFFCINIATSCKSLLYCIWVHIIWTYKKRLIL